MNSIAAFSSRCHSQLRFRALALLLAAAGLYSAGLMSARAATFAPLQSFTFTGPQVPEARLTQGPSGNFYGTTHSDSVNSCGTVYEITPAGVLSTVHTFDCTDGAFPDASLTLGADGNFYGVTTNGNGAANMSGEIFKVSPSGTFSIVHAFSSATDGAFPSSGLLLAADGNFYGVTSTEGPNGNGTVYQLTPSGVFSVIHSFTGAEGAAFGSGLVQASDGNLYGVSGGNCGGTACATAGNVYRVTTAGVFTNLHEFNDGTDGGYPTGALAVGADGNLYGTTNAVIGPAGDGTVFKITLAGVLTTIHTFIGTDGNVPVGGLVQASDDNFYGVTKNGGIGCSNGACGTVFSISPAGAFNVVYNFTAADDGKYPAAGLLVASNGNLYGTASSSGSADEGNVFVVSLGSPPPAPPAPTGLVASAGNAQVALSWAAASGATSYNIYDGESAGGESSTAIATGVTGTSYTVTGLANGTKYFFKVASVNGNGTSSLSNEASATPAAPAPSLPGQVTGLSATAAAGQVALGWSAATNATGYTIKSGTTSGAETTLATGVTATTFTAAGLTNGTTYYFIVEATNTAGTGPASSEVSATPSAGMAAAPTFSPAGGSYTAPQSVTLSDATSGAIIYYTTDGSAPTTASKRYNGAVSVTATETLKAMASATGYQASAVSSATYTITTTTQTSTTTLSGRAGGGALGLPEVLGLIALIVIGRLRTSARRLGAWAPFILIAAMPCLPARAQEVRPDFANTYLGVRVGTSQYATSGSDLTQALVNAGYADSSASIDSHRTVGSVYAGVPFFGPLALELGYVDLGRYPVAITTRSTQYAGVAQTALDTMRPAGRGATLGFGATVDLGRWFAVNPHVALLMLQSKQDITTPAGTFSDNRHDAGVAAGLALLFRPTRHLYLGGGVDCWGGGAHCDVLAYTADLEFHFANSP